MNFTIEEIVILMDKMSQTGLGELTFSDNDTTLKIKATKTIYSTNAPQSALSTQCANTIEATLNTATTSETISSVSPSLGTTITSPIVGTFYAASAPNNPPYVKVGSKVKKGDVLFVIESMKLMNEITSEFDGEVIQILVENSSGVEFAQPIMVIN